MKRCCITGHRSEKLGGYDWDSQRNQNIMRKLRATYIYLIETEGVTEFMFGGALGTDQMAYAVCKKLKDEKYPNIKLLLAIPFKNQYVKWKNTSIDVWKRQVDTADDVIYVDELRDTRFFNSYCGLGNYHISKMQNRNEYMVDWVSEAESGYVIAVWNGSDSGTKNCVDYAREKGGLKIGILNPLDY